MTFIVSIVLLALSLIAVVGNWSIPVRWLFDKSYRGSMIPFAGGVFGTVGLTLGPFPGAAEYWWVPPIADLGTVPALIGLIIRVVWQRRRRDL